MIMRLLVLFCLTGLMTGIANAQPWKELLPANKTPNELTFYDYQQAFYSYWEPFNVTEGYYEQHGERIKATGYKQFKRWEYWNKFRINPATGEFPKRSALSIVREYETKQGGSREEEGDWKSIGPSVTIGGYAGLGRLNCVAFHPTDPNTVWVGAASGGLWVTEDNGETWTCLTDNNESLGISDIIIAADYDESGIIYIATGDRDGIDNISIGVLKSNDRGQSWQETGLHFEFDEFRFINRLLVHPDFPNTLYAATTIGVYRTIDGGDNWDEEISAEAFIDMEFHPSDPSIMYGSTFDGEVFRSLNGGNSWSRTLYAFDSGRMEMAVSPAQPDWVYAVGVTGGLDGLYKSIDKGLTFEKILEGDTLNIMHWNCNGIGTGGQGYYDLGMAVSPTDANTILIGGVNTWRSTDGGVSWQVSNCFAGSTFQIAHADKHYLRFRSTGELWECNDGGAYASYDNGVTWEHKSNGMAIGQIYKISVSATNPNEVLIGLQDNGSKLFSGGNWLNVNGGDGTDCIIHPVDNNIQFTTTQYGSLFRTYDHWETARYIKPNEAGSGGWVTPFKLDPNNPNIIYGGFKEVWKSLDLGETWTKVSTINAFNYLENIAIAPTNSNIVYAAESGRIYKSVTGGEPFEKLPNNFGPANTNQVSTITIKNDNEEVLWVSVAGFWDPGVWQSNDGGGTWINISEGLPAIPVYTVIQNIQSVDEVELYAGTELGVYVKRGDLPWVPFSKGLPNVIVSELEFYYSTDPTQSILRAGTYGRGAWETRVRFNSFPMEHVSTTAVHNNLASVNPGLTEQEMLKIEIQTTGDLEPLHVTSFTLSTTGSTDAQNGIANARLFYSVNINGFITTTPFGEIVNKPNGEFVIEGDQPLLAGSNFFWLTYDIEQEATLGSHVDAACLSVNLGNDIIPAITHPEGSRLIDLTYCDAGSTQISQEYIKRVVSGSVDQVSQKGPNGYEDHTDQIIPAETGTPLQVAVTNHSPHTTNELMIWADWNRDGNFDDTDELQYRSGPSGVTTYQATITPPAHVKTGHIRMRIRLHDTSFGPNDQPCGVANLGEVEDYTLDVQEIMTATEFPTGWQLKVSPNPAAGSIWVNAPVAAGSGSIQLISSLGTLHKAGTGSTGNNIDISHLAQGIYLLRMHVNNRTYYGRFTKL